MDTTERIEVRRLTQDAIILYENAGKETLLREIADSTGRFVLNERYTFALDLNGIMVAHPMEPELTGRNLIDLTDSEENAFIRKIVDTERPRAMGSRNTNGVARDRRMSITRPFFSSGSTASSSAAGFTAPKKAHGTELSII